MLCDTLYRVCRKTLWLIALGLSGMIFFLNILYTSEVASTGYEYVTVSGHFLKSIPMLVIAACLVVILSCFRQSVENISETGLFSLFSGIYTVLAVYLIFNVDNTIRADAKTVYTTALEVKEGIYTAFQPGWYMYRYPHQLGLMLYDQILTEFSENPSFLFLVNFVLVLGINHTSWKISNELFHDSLTNVLTIFFSFAFLPQLFFILFAYGLIPGFFFMMLGFYYVLKYVRTEAIGHLLAMFLSVGAAVVLKQNFLIGGIAIAIYLFLNFLQKRKLGILAIIAAVFFSMTVPAGIIKLCYEQAADIKLDSSSPTVLWIAMGTDIDNDVRGPGWYDSSSWNLYNEAHYDTDKASELGMKKMEANWEKIKSEPARAGRFFLDKTISQWCDPLYESTWSGPLEDCGQYTHTEILQSVYTGGSWAEGITGYLKILCLALWGLSAAYLLLQGKGTSGWETMYLYFIGGLLFHTLWEGKSQYTYPYLFVLIPFASCAVRQLIMKKE